jgi:hypothetical protein
VAEQVTFGRRGVRPPAAEPAPEPAPARAPDRPEPSSADLEAFAASVRAAKASDVAAFARWRREQLPRRLLIILLRFALLTPGVICILAQAPWWVSLGLEGTGLAANVWLRQERRRQASAIAAWTPEG